MQSRTDATGLRTKMTKLYTEETETSLKDVLSTLEDEGARTEEPSAELRRVHWQQEVIGQCGVIAGQAAVQAQDWDEAEKQLTLVRPHANQSLQKRRRSI